MTTSLHRPTRRDTRISAATLCLVCPFMAEVLSSNGTPWDFVTHAWGLIPIYGFPILLLREWALRRGVSLGGLLLAGFGYGLFNEGLVAKTLFLNRHVPWGLFDGHVGAGGVNWGWLLVICAYHSLFAIVTPLLLIERLRPQTAGATWLSGWSAGALLLVVALISTTYFSQRPHTAPPGFWGLWAGIGASVVAASLWRGGWTAPRAWQRAPDAGRTFPGAGGTFPGAGRTRPGAWSSFPDAGQSSPDAGRLSIGRSAWLGAAFLPVLLVGALAFSRGMPLWAFAFGWGAWVLCVGRCAVRGGAVGALRVGLGAYAGMSALNIVVGSPVAKLVGAAALLLILFHPQSPAR